MSFLSRLFRRNSAPARVAPPPLAPAPQLVPLGEAFTPTQPKTGRRRLIGRQAELARILQALNEDRAHVVLYSERGRGKTSLSNLTVQSLRRNGVIVARHTCEAGTTFDSLMRGLARDLPPALLAARTGAGGEGCEAALPDGELRPRDVAALPGRLACRGLVCLVDEFDRVNDPLTRTRLADTIKLLSDRDAPLLFLIVGVSENLEQILGQHPSIQRSVIGIHLPLLTDRDVAQLITKGGREAGFTFQQTAIARITVLARGMPYMAQLLGLRLTQAAAARGDTQVSEEDFDSAVTRMAQDMSPRVQALYSDLTSHGRDGEMAQVLRRISTAPQDAWGRLQVARLDDAVLVGGRAVSAACWDRLLAAGILAPVAPGSGQFIFAERPLMHHTLLLAARDVAALDGAESSAGLAPRTLHVVSQG
jgi:hypothetical protein